MKKVSKRVKKALDAFLVVIILIGVVPIGILAADRTADTGGISGPFVEPNFQRVVHVDEFIPEPWQTADGLQSGFRISFTASPPYSLIFPNDVIFETRPAVIAMLEAGYDGSFRPYHLVIPVGTRVDFLAVNMLPMRNIGVAYFDGVQGSQVRVRDIQSVGGWHDYTFNSIGYGEIYIVWEFWDDDVEHGGFPSGVQSIVFTFEVIGKAAPTEPIIQAQTETQAATSTNDTISVIVNGTAVNFTDQQPTLVDGRTLVPVRGVFEALGFEVEWNGERQEVTLSRYIINDGYLSDSPIGTHLGLEIITISIGREYFQLEQVGTIFNRAFNDTPIPPIPLDVPAQIIGGSTMLPIRAVLEVVGYSLDWDGANQTVIITTDTLNEVNHTAPLTTAQPNNDPERITLSPREFHNILEDDGDFWTVLTDTGEIVRIVNPELSRADASRVLMSVTLGTEEATSITITTLTLRNETTEGLFRVTDPDTVITNPWGAGFGVSPQNMPADGLILRVEQLENGQVVRDLGHLMGGGYMGLSIMGELGDFRLTLVQAPVGLTTTMFNATHGWQNNADGVPFLDVDTLRWGIGQPNGLGLILVQE